MNYLKLDINSNPNKSLINKFNEIIPHPNLSQISAQSYITNKNNKILNLHCVEENIPINNNNNISTNYPQIKQKISTLEKKLFSIFEKIKNNEEIVSNLKIELQNLKTEKNTIKNDIVNLLANKESLEEVYKNQLSLLISQNINYKYSNIQNFDIEINDIIKDIDIKIFTEQVIAMYNELFNSSKTDNKLNIKKLKSIINNSYNAFIKDCDNINNYKIIFENFLAKISLFFSNQSLGKFSENNINLFLRYILKLNFINNKINSNVKYVNKKYKDKKINLKEDIKKLQKINQNLEKKYKNLVNSVNDFKNQLNNTNYIEDIVINNNTINENNGVNIDLNSNSLSTSLNLLQDFMGFKQTYSSYAEIYNCLSNRNENERNYTLNDGKQKINKEDVKIENINKNNDNNDDNNNTINNNSKKDKKYYYRHVDKDNNEDFNAKDCFYKNVNIDYNDKSNNNNISNISNENIKIEEIEIKNDNETEEEENDKLGIYNIDDIEKYYSELYMDSYDTNKKSYNSQKVNDINNEFNKSDKYNKIENYFYIKKVIQNIGEKNVEINKKIIKNKMDNEINLENIYNEKKNKQSNNIDIIKEIGNNEKKIYTKKNPVAKCQNKKCYFATNQNIHEEISENNIDKNEIDSIKEDQKNIQMKVKSTNSYGEINKTYKKYQNENEKFNDKNKEKKIDITVEIENDIKINNEENNNNIIEKSNNISEENNNNISEENNNNISEEDNNNILKEDNNNILKEDNNNITKENNNNFSKKNNNNFSKENNISNFDENFNISKEKYKNIYERSNDKISENNIFYIYGKTNNNDSEKIKNINCTEILMKKTKNPGEIKYIGDGEKYLKSFNIEEKSINNCANKKGIITPNNIKKKEYELIKENQIEKTINIIKNPNIENNNITYTFSKQILNEEKTKKKNKNNIISKEISINFGEKEIKTNNKKFDDLHLKNEKNEKYFEDKTKQIPNKITHNEIIINSQTIKENHEENENDFSSSKIKNIGKLEANRNEFQENKLQENEIQGNKIEKNGIKENKFLNNDKKMKKRKKKKTKKIKNDFSTENITIKTDDTQNKNQSNMEKKNIDNNIKNFDEHFQISYISIRESKKIGLVNEKDKNENIENIRDKNLDGDPRFIDINNFSENKEDNNDLKKSDIISNKNKLNKYEDKDNQNYINEEVINNNQIIEKINDIKIESKINKYIHENSDNDDVNKRQKMILINDGTQDQKKNENIEYYDYYGNINKNKSISILDELKIQNVISVRIYNKNDYKNKEQNNLTSGESNNKKIGNEKSFLNKNNNQIISSNNNIFINGENNKLISNITNNKISIFKQYSETNMNSEKISNEDIVNNKVIENIKDIGSEKIRIAINDKNNEELDNIINDKNNVKNQEKIIINNKKNDKIKDENNEKIIIKVDEYINNLINDKVNNNNNDELINQSNNKIKNNNKNKELTFQSNNKIDENKNDELVCQINNKIKDNKTDELNYKFNNIINNYKNDELTYHSNIQIKNKNGDGLICQNNDKIKNKNKNEELIYYNKKIDDNKNDEFIYQSNNKINIEINERNIENKKDKINELLVNNTNNNLIDEANDSKYIINKKTKNSKLIINKKGNNNKIIPKNILTEDHLEITIYPEDKIQENIDHSKPETSQIEIIEQKNILNHIKKINDNSELNNIIAKEKLTYNKIIKKKSNNLIYIRAKSNEKITKIKRNINLSKIRKKKHIDNSLINIKNTNENTINKSAKLSRTNINRTPKIYYNKKKQGNFSHCKSKNNENIKESLIKSEEINTTKPVKNILFNYLNQKKKNNTNINNYNDCIVNYKHLKEKIISNENKNENFIEVNRNIAKNNEVENINNNNNFEIIINDKNINKLHETKNIIKNIYQDNNKKNKPKKINNQNNNSAATMNNITSIQKHHSINNKPINLILKNKSLDDIKIGINFNENYNLNKDKNKEKKNIIDINDMEEPEPLKFITLPNNINNINKFDINGKIAAETKPSISINKKANLNKLEIIEIPNYNKILFNNSLSNICSNSKNVILSKSMNLSEFLTSKSQNTTNNIINSDRNYTKISNINNFNRSNTLLNTSKNKKILPLNISSSHSNKRILRKYFTTLNNNNNYNNIVRGLNGIDIKNGLNLSDLTKNVNNNTKLNSDINQKNNNLLYIDNNDHYYNNLISKDYKIKNNFNISQLAKNSEILNYNKNKNRSQIINISSSNSFNNIKDSKTLKPKNISILDSNLRIIKNTKRTNENELSPINPIKSKNKIAKIPIVFNTNTNINLNEFITNSDILPNSIEKAKINDNKNNIVIIKNNNDNIEKKNISYFYEGEIIQKNEKKINTNEFNFENSAKFFSNGIMESFCYFKFVSLKNNKKFNPLDCSATPENFGYSEGYISIDVILGHLKIIPEKNELISQNSLDIELKDIDDVKMNIRMKNIVKIHKIFLKYNSNSGFEYEDNNGKIKKRILSINKLINMKEINEIPMDQNEKIKAALCNFFTFELIFGKKVECIFINFEQFNVWFKCLEKIAENNSKSRESSLSYRKLFLKKNRNNVGVRK